MLRAYDRGRKPGKARGQDGEFERRARLQDRTQSGVPFSDQRALDDRGIPGRGAVDVGFGEDVASGEIASPEGNESREPSAAHPCFDEGSPGELIERALRLFRLFHAQPTKRLVERQM